MLNFTLASRGSHNHTIGDWNPLIVAPSSYMQLDPALGRHSAPAIECDRAENNERVQAARQHAHALHRECSDTEWFPRSSSDGSQWGILHLFQRWKGENECENKGENVQDFCESHCYFFSLPFWDTPMNLPWVLTPQFSKRAFTRGRLRECMTRIYPKSPVKAPVTKDLNGIDRVLLSLWIWGARVMNSSYLNLRQLITETSHFRA